MQGVDTARLVMECGLDFARSRPTIRSSRCGLVWKWSSPPNMVVLQIQVSSSPFSRLPGDVTSQAA